MARNRKSQSAAIRFAPALKAAVLCVLISGSGVGYVWQKDQIQRLGQAKQKREVLLHRLEYENDVLRKRLTQLYSPQVLEQRIKDLKLGLVLPQPAQIVHVVEPVPEGPNTNTNTVRQFASQTQRKVIMP